MIEHAPVISERPVEYQAVPLEMNAPVDEVRLAALPVSQVVEYPAPREDPLCYPGARPEHAFSTLESQVMPIRAIETEEGVRFGITTPEGVFDLDDVLRENGVETMANRIPIVGFGSNASPGQLAHKFSEGQDKHGDITNPGDHHIVPTLRGKIKDVAAAYSSRLGINGYFFAELIEAKDAETEVFVNFLSPAQLVRMHRSESQYDLCDIGEVTIDGVEAPIQAYGYVGKNNVLLDGNGKPVLLDSVHCEGAPDCQSMSEVEVLDMVAHEFGGALDEAYPHAPVHANSARNLMALASYRMEWLRRKNTKVMTYKHAVGEDDPQDALIAVTLQQILNDAGRVSTDKLLDTLPDEKRNVTPQPFGQLYASSQR